MNNFTPETTESIIDEVKNLISYSLSNLEEDKSGFENFHKSVVEIYFNAKKISMDYSAQTIDLQLPTSNKEYTGITFECLDLCGFLRSCIKCDEKSLSFYQELLSQHNIVIAA
ncbi:hypothetical protein [Gillisia limnaea]|uniref:Uncharacterized protein n=1 Tax=Gillisia limnaea (strain DSM 15749 / LMG 21470 / R-8282) TaxID=865937 RepID=H2BYD7_GILLR|nr:hypothetical protein [Gillisia limnaea]EHQ03276.1 hypothetical protein Gilli_2660 [Gillisia limnaea DSM 15749]